MVSLPRYHLSCARARTYALFSLPFPLAGSITHACCNARAPAIPSGGLWVLQPSEKIGTDLWRMMVQGKPKFVGGWGKDVPEMLADGTQATEYWHWGDMQVRDECGIHISASDDV